MRSLRLSVATLVAVASSLAAGPAASRAASDIVVKSYEKKTYDCHGGTLTVDGGFNVLTLRNCLDLIVNGGDNTIDAGVVESIVVSGADNRITWTESPDGKRPKITNEGEDNTIVSKKAAPGTARTPPPSGAKPGAPPQASHVTVSGDQVKVQGAEGTVTVGADGTVSVDEGAAAPASGRIRVDQDGQRQAYDCRGADAVVNGDRNEVSFRNCSQVSVNGVANVVEVKGVQSVQINGDGNKVTWEPADDGSRPRIADKGRGNTVSGKR